MGEADPRKMLGVMVDCSRNAVLSVPSVKRFADVISQMGYNALMLYTEDTYEVEGQPFFGHFRGRYSREELSEIDGYCARRGVELIPCIQTLAHLNCMFKQRAVYGDINDCDDILLAGDERTYKLIDDMLKSLSSCVRSRKIHIGMDEAYRVGTGKYKTKNGERDRFEVINEHLHKVCGIAAKYGYEPMIWSDMFVKLATGNDSQYAHADPAKIKEKAALPESVSLVYWDYYSDDPVRYERMIGVNKLFGRPVYFAGGAWTWNGFCPDNEKSIRNTRAALSACKARGVDGVFVTLWGDDGAECSPFAVLPSLLCAAEFYKGNEDLEDIKEKFARLCGASFDGFTLFDALDKPGGKHGVNPSKYLFYNDLFCGKRDPFVGKDDGAYYAALSRKIKGVSEKGEYAYLFDVYEKLADVLSIKCDMGARLRKAYRKGDRRALSDILSDLPALEEKIEAFYTAHKNRWFYDNKPYGFDVQDIRIGGLLRRVRSCRERLSDYLSGKINEIPELSEPQLWYEPDKAFWAETASANDIGWRF